MKPPRPSLPTQMRMGPGLLRNPFDGAVEIRRRFGDVVDVGFGPTRLTWLFGREANEFVLSTHADHFRWRDTFSLLIPVDGDTALVVTDGDEHRRRRRLVQPAFGIRHIERQVPLVMEEAARATTGWSAGTPVELWSTMRTAIRRIVIRALFGDRLGERAHQMGDDLEPILQYVSRNPLARFDREWPGTPYRRAMTARRRADAVVYDEIAHRRARPDDTGDDVLSWLLGATDDEGGPSLTDLEIRDQVMSLIAAGYDTTTGGIAWLLWALLAHPDVLRETQAQVRDELPMGTDVTADDLARLPLLDHAVQESLRLYPPGPVSGRGVARPVTFQGVDLEPGTRIVFSTYVTARDQTLWDEPLAFRPSRFDPDAPGYREPLPYSYVPFGGGPRRCIGFALATLEMKALAAHVLRDFDLTLDSTSRPRPTGIATMIPAGGVHVTVSARR